MMTHRQLADSRSTHTPLRDLTAPSGVMHRSKRAIGHTQRYTAAGAGEY